MGVKSGFSAKWSPQGSEVRVQRSGMKDVRDTDGYPAVARDRKIVDRKMGEDTITMAHHEWNADFR